MRTRTDGEVVEVLLDDGWHRASQYVVVGDEFRFKETVQGETRTVRGPLASVLAVRERELPPV